MMMTAVQTVDLVEAKIEIRARRGRFCRSLRRRQNGNGQGADYDF